MQKGRKCFISAETCAGWLGRGRPSPLGAWMWRHVLQPVLDAGQWATPTNNTVLNGDLLLAPSNTKHLQTNSSALTGSPADSSLSVVASGLPDSRSHVCRSSSRCCSSGGPTRALHCSSENAAAAPPGGGQRGVGLLKPDLPRPRHLSQNNLRSPSAAPSAGINAGVQPH